MNKAYSTFDLKQVSKHGTDMIKVNVEVSSKLKNNDLFKEEKNPDQLNDEMEVIKD